MKKTPFYRRRTGCKNDGFKELACWQLSKRAMTGMELAKILKMTVTDLHAQMRWQVGANQTATIEASEWITDSEGNRDRIYTLTSRPQRITPKAGKTIVVSVRSFSLANEEQRQKNIIAAQRRARLIAAGLYITEL